MNEVSREPSDPIDRVKLCGLLYWCSGRRTWKLSRRFYLAACLYFFAVSALLMFWFDEWYGSIFGGSVFSVWFCLAAIRSRALMIAVPIVCVAAFILLPVGGHPREHRDRSQCTNNLKMVMFALHDYHDAHGKFPPAYLPDKDGKPMHSWRVLILPYMEQQKVYDRYRFDEPWNSEHNQALAKEVPIFHCPSAGRLDPAKRDSCNYFAVIGDHAAWRPDGVPRKLSDFADGTSNTIGLIEGATIDNWMEPKDISYDDAYALLNSDSEGKHLKNRRLFRKPKTWRQCAMTDGAVRAVTKVREEWMAKCFLQLDDGEQINVDDIHEKRREYSQSFQLFVWYLTLFVLFFPTPWIWSMSE